MNKILVIGLIICNCQFANASDTGNNQNSITNIDKYMGIKNSINNVLTFANSNSKCWFVSTFQLFVTALNQSESNSPIRKTNFAKFVNHLKTLNNTPRRIYEKGELNKLRPSEWHFSTTGMWETHNLTKDRTGKSNIIGERIDLISELITWGAKHNWMYDQNKNNTHENNGNTINTENIIEDEKDRRNHALRLLAQIQDMNSPTDCDTSISIILNIFPELKQYFGSYLNETTKKDTMIDNAEKIMLNDKERTNDFIDIIQNNRIPSSIEICRKKQVNL